MRATDWTVLNWTSRNSYMSFQTWQHAQRIWTHVLTQVAMKRLDFLICTQVGTVLSAVGACANQSAAHIGMLTTTFHLKTTRIPSVRMQVSVNQTIESIMLLFCTCFLYHCVTLQLDRSDPSTHGPLTCRHSWLIGAGLSMGHWQHWPYVRILETLTMAQELRLSAILGLGTPIVHYSIWSYTIQYHYTTLKKVL